MPAIGAVGVDLCLEPLAPTETNFLNTCAQATSADRPGQSSPFQAAHGRESPERRDGTTVPELIRQYARSAGHFHAQDVNLRGPGMGDVDFGPIMQALVESGYDRWVSVEVFDFSPGAEETARQSIACLRRELAAAQDRT